MAKTIITKQCCTCKEIKPISDYYKNRTANDGLQTVCKSCGRFRECKYRKTEKRKNYQQQYQSQYYYLHLDRYRAKDAVNHAIRAGKLPRPDSLKCHCGEQAEQYHHHKGYAKKHWLDVIPVCKECHYKQCPQKM